MRIPDDAEEFEYGGYRFLRWTEVDDLGPPWEEHDGHGPVREVRYHRYEKVPKKPGERVLHKDDGHAWLYDWQEAVRIAKRDGWDAPPYGGSPGERAARAVQADFDHLRRWLTNEWWWVGVCVQQIDEDGYGCPIGPVESLWGIESDLPNYHKQVAEELADQLLGPLEDIEREREIALLEAD